MAGSYRGPKRPTAAVLQAARAAQAPEKKTPPQHGAAGRGLQNKARKTSFPQSTASFSEIKERVRGREPDILANMFGLTLPKRAGHGGPCPNCGGKDRFNWWRDRAGTWRCKCRSCDLSGDIFDTLIGAGVAASLADARRLLDEVS